MFTLQEGVVGHQAGMPSGQHPSQPVVHVDRLLSDTCPGAMPFPLMTV